MPEKEWLNDLSEEAMDHFIEGIEKHENDLLEGALDDFERVIFIEIQDDSTENDNADASCKNSEEEEDTSIEPHLFWVWLSKGKVHLDKGQYDKAVNCYDRATSIAPEYKTAWINKADALRKKGEYLEATRSCGKVTHQEPEHQVAAAIIWASEGMMYRRRGELRKAEECLSKALDIYPLSDVKPHLSEIREELDEGEIYLTTDKGERKATGSYYTPEYIVQYIVENTLDPILDDIREDLLREEGGDFANDFAERVFELKVLDPAMGSGHFLTNAVDHLAREIVNAHQRQAEEEGAETVDEEHDIHWARRQVAQKCIYGVDLNPMAVELAKVSLWLRTLAAQQPLAFLDHHLMTGNSLIGSDIENIEELDSGKDREDKDTATLEDFGMTWKGTMKDLMGIYQDFIKIENQELSDIKEMEEKFHEFEHEPIKERLEAMANVHTAREFGVDVPDDAFTKMARFIDDENKWDEINEEDWFGEAQELAEGRNFFHWKLAFPEVFYEDEGGKKEDTGFDVVIGNPPYGANLTKQDRSYLLNNFNTSEKYKNTGLQFIELCDTLTKAEGIYGQIVPKPLSYSQKWSIGRNLILPKLKVAIDVSRAFEGVLYEQIIFIADKKTHDDSYLTAKGDEGGFKSTVMVEKEYCRDLDTLILNTKEKYLHIFQKITWKENLGDISKTSRGLPYQKYRTNSGCPVYGGKHISRYHLKSTNEYLEEDKIDESKDKVQFVKQPKVISQRIVAHVTTPTDRIIIMSTLDKEGKLTLDTIENTVLTDDEYSLELITAIFNSNLFSWYAYEFIFSKAIRTMDFDDYYVSKFPIPKQNYQNSLLEKKVREIPDIKSKHADLNLNLEDYLSNYSEGKSLEDIYNRIEGISDTILIDTTADREKLKLGSIEFEENKDELILKVSARYKPEDDEEFTEDELDQWGYTETELIPAMKFTGDEMELALIREFTKLAVDEGVESANFYENATKRISILDRLENLTLPRLSDVEKGLEKYLKKKEKAEELEEEIKETDHTIDAIVFNLYELTEAEVEVVLYSLDTPEDEKEDILNKFRNVDN